jgi:small conductance mechanosensitive channel
MVAPTPPAPDAARSAVPTENAVHDATAAPAPPPPPPPHAAPEAPGVDPADLTIWATKAAIEWGGRVVAVLILLSVAWVLGAWVRRMIGRLLDRPQIDQTLARFLGNFAKWVILVMAVVGCLGFFGFNITGLAALIGAAGLTIGLALQGSLSNLAAGIMLLVLRPFRIGDVVQVAGVIGKVDDIDLFNTKIDTGDNRRLIIPNGQIANGIVENMTHHAQRRCDITVGTAYACDVERARAALRRAAESMTARDPSKPVDVLLMNLGTHAVEWSVRVWFPTAEFWPNRDRLLAAIKRELDRAQIPIPFPQTEVWLRGDGRAAPAEAEAPALR